MDRPHKKVSSAAVNLTAGFISFIWTSTSTSTRESSKKRYASSSPFSKINENCGPALLFPFWTMRLKKAYDRENGEKDIQYVSIPWESEKSHVTVEDAELKQIYPMVKDKLTEPEKVKLNYIFIPKDQQTAQAAALAEKDASIEELSAKYNLSEKGTGLFLKERTVPEIGLSDKITSLSFSLPQGKTSEWVSLEKGFYKIAVSDKKGERPLSLEEAKDELGKILLKQKASEAAVKKLDDLKKKTAGQDFEKALSAENLTVQKFEKLKKGLLCSRRGARSLDHQCRLEREGGRDKRRLRHAYGGGARKSPEKCRLGPEQFCRK